jgi:uncharacterized protein YabE (DUF348 family)
MSTPFVEEFVVIRKRVRISDDGPEQQLLVWSTAKDSDSIIAALERAKWSVGHRDYIYSPELRVDGLPEVEV